MIQFHVDNFAFRIERNRKDKSVIVFKGIVKLGKERLSNLYVLRINIRLHLAEHLSYLFFFIFKQ